MTNSEPNRLNRIEVIIESNARAIEALTNSMQEMRRDRTILYQTMADVTQSQASIYRTLENLDSRQGQIVEILRLLANKINQDNANP